MESSILVGGALASLAIKSYGCLGKSKNKKWNKVHLACLVMSKSTGKTRLCEKLKGYSKLILVDINESLQSGEKQNEADALIEAKEYVDGLKKKLKEYKLVLLCDSIDQAKFLGIPDENTIVATPSNRLFNTILETRLSVADKEILETSRMELISNTDRDTLNVFDSFETLYSTIKTAFKLQNKF